MYGKLVNNKLIIVGNVINYNGTTIINPTREQYLQCGYKEINENNKPKYDNLKQYLIKTYSETETTIIVNYEIKDYDKEIIRNNIKAEILRLESLQTDRLIREASIGYSKSRRKLIDIDKMIIELRKELKKYK